ncbi:MAG: glucosamine-6-phosphate deaminase [Subdoligranulum sp.]|nr:glucosamine-6-phosphate deaminase [Subdoligranulum sp.]
MKPDSLIGLSTGRTTGPIHKALAEIYKAHPFDTSRVTFFGLDEVTNVSRDYFGSCYYMLLHEVIEPLDVPMEHYIMPPTTSDDWDAACARFEGALAQCGQVDLQILGIGGNGHIGFNQPGTSFGQTAWTSVMEPWLYERIRKETNSPEGAPLGGVTLGIKNVMQSKRILLAANGTPKAEIIRAAVHGPVTEDVPASILQLHPDCDVYVDAAAGALL